jgi:PAS domain S-box-containing protein
MPASDDVETMGVPSQPAGPMSESELLAGDVRGVLQNMTVPSYLVDKTGVIRWLNPAATELFGDVRGQQYTSVIAPEDTRHAREVFTRKIIGAVSVTEAEAVFLKADRTKVSLELCAVPLRSGDHIVGVFGQVVREPEEPPRAPHPHLTPRQAEVLRLLEQGHSTRQIAEELHLSTETVRNHIRHVFRVLGVHSRIEAVAAARRGAWLTD